MAQQTVAERSEQAKDTRSSGRSAWSDVELERIERQRFMDAKAAEKAAKAARIASRREENDLRTRQAHEIAIRRAPSGHRVGESHGRAVACDATVERARQLREDHGWTYARIGAELCVHWRTVADWCNYRTR